MYLSPTLSGTDGFHLLPQVQRKLFFAHKLPNRISSTNKYSELGSLSLYEAGKAKHVIFFTMGLPKSVRILSRCGTERRRTRNTCARSSPNCAKVGPDRIRQNSILSILGPVRLCTTILYQLRAFWDLGTYGDISYCSFIIYY